MMWKFEFSRFAIDDASSFQYLARFPHSNQFPNVPRPSLFADPSSVGVNALLVVLLVDQEFPSGLVFGDVVPGFCQPLC